MVLYFRNVHLDLPKIFALFWTPVLSRHGEENLTSWKNHLVHLWPTSFIRANYVQPPPNKIFPVRRWLIGCRKRRKLKELIPRVVVFVNDSSSAERRIDLSLVLFYGCMVGKYALICAMEIPKIHIVVHIFSGFALFTELMWVYRGVESLCKLLTANKVPFDLPTNECKSKYCPS